LKYICEKGDDIAIWEQRMADADAEKATTKDMLSIGDEEWNETEKLLDADLPNTGYCVPILQDRDYVDKYDLPMDILPDREEYDFSLQEVVAIEK